MVVDTQICSTPPPVAPILQPLPWDHRTEAGKADFGPDLVTALPCLAAQRVPLLHTPPSGWHILSTARQTGTTSVPQRKGPESLPFFCFCGFFFFLLVNWVRRKTEYEKMQVMVARLSFCRMLLGPVPLLVRTGALRGDSGDSGLTTAVTAYHQGHWCLPGTMPAAGYVFSSLLEIC